MLFLLIISNLSKSTFLDLTHIGGRAPGNPGRVPTGFKMPSSPPKHVTPREGGKTYRKLGSSQLADEFVRKALKARHAPSVSLPSCRKMRGRLSRAYSVCYFFSALENSGQKENK